MGNFFWGDEFYSEVSDLLNIVSETEDLSDLEEDWSIECQGSVLEPIFELSAEKIFEKLGGEDRDDENYEAGEKAIDVLNKHIDFEKINSLLPKLYYPKRGDKFIITKKDLLEYL
jgi:hypothetical protein